MCLDDLVAINNYRRMHPPCPQTASVTKDSQGSNPLQQGVPPEMSVSRARLLRNLMPNKLSRHSNYQVNAAKPTNNFFSSA